MFKAMEFWDQSKKLIQSEAKKPKFAKKMCTPHFLWVWTSDHGHDCSR